MSFGPAATRKVSDKLLEPLIPLPCFYASRYSCNQSGANMNRKSWSNVFILVSAVNLVLGILPSNPLKIVDWVMVPIFIVMAVAARRKMI